MEMNKYLKIFFKIIVSALAVFITSWLLPGVHVDGFITALIVAASLALLNYLIKPLLVILTIPVTIVTFGLFLLAINAFIILIASHYIDGFKVDGFWWALLFSIILSLVTSLLELFNVSMNRKINRY